MPGFPTQRPPGRFRVGSLGLTKLMMSRRLVFRHMSILLTRLPFSRTPSATDFACGLAFASSLDVIDRSYQLLRLKTRVLCSVQ